MSLFNWLHQGEIVPGRGNVVQPNAQALGR